MIMIKIAIAFTVMLASLPLNAAIYKWIDEQGEVHYSQSPPKQKSATRMHIPSQRTAASNTEPDTSADQSAADNKQSHESEPASNQQNTDNAAELIKKCQSARQALTTLQQDKRVFTVDEQGERHYFDDMERSSRIAQLKQNIDKYCQ